MPGSSLLTSCVAGAGAGAGMVGPPVVAAAAIAPEWGGVKLILPPVAPDRVI